MGKIAKKSVDPTQKRSGGSKQSTKLTKPKLSEMSQPPIATHVKKVNKKESTVPSEVPVVDHKLKLKRTRNNRIKKKDKQKLKKEKVLEKVELTKKAFKEDKARKKREKTAVTGDLRPLMDCLPSLEELYHLKGPSTRTGVPEFDVKDKKEMKKINAKIRANEFLNRYDKYKQLLQIGSQRDNPRQMIADHIKRMKMQNNSQMSM